VNKSAPKIWYWHFNLQKNTDMEQNGYRWFGWIIRPRKDPGSVMGLLNCNVRASKLKKCHHRFGLFVCLWWQDGTRWNYNCAAKRRPGLPGVTSQLEVSTMSLISPFSPSRLGKCHCNGRKEHGGHDIWDGRQALCHVASSLRFTLVTCPKFPLQTIPLAYDSSYFGYFLRLQVPNCRPVTHHPAIQVATQH